MTFLIQCSGELPASGVVQLAAAAARHTHSQIELKPLGLDERLARLREAAHKLNDALVTGTGDLARPWREEVETLVRFDAVYYSHFKCNLRRLIDYPRLWRYTRRIYALPGVARTVDLGEIKSHYYRSMKQINPTQIVPKGPLIDFRLR